MNRIQSITRSAAVATIAAAGILGLPARAADAAASFATQVLATAPAAPVASVSVAREAGAPALAAAEGFVGTVLQPVTCTHEAPASTQTAQGGERGPTERFVQRVLRRVDG